MSKKELDCSDIDQYLGKPMAPARMSVFMKRWNAE